MNIYLQHYFDPDFDHLKVKPCVNTLTGEADCYNLGYVQNVLAGQVLAALVPADAVENPDPRFVLEEPLLPQGTNTRVDPAHPDYLLAAVNGYVYYDQGKITVKDLLNVRSDVDFHTGNIFFVGDLVLHKDLKAGFEIQGNTVLIRGMVEGGVVRARKNLRVLGGIKGGTGNRCLASSGQDLRAAFCEKAELRSEGSLFIDRFCLHSTLYATHSLEVTEKCIGGFCRVGHQMIVHQDLGNMAGVATRILLGYDPLTVRRLERCEERIVDLSERITHYTAVAGHLAPETNELTRDLAFAREQRAHLNMLRESLLRMLAVDEAGLQACTLVVRGKVHPGVEVSIGQPVLTVREPLHNVMFRLEGREILVEPAPAKMPQSARTSRKTPGLV